MGSSHISKKINWSTKYCKYSSAKADSTLSKTKPSTIIPSQLAFAPRHGGASFARTGPNASQAPRQQSAVLTWTCLLNAVHRPYDLAALHLASMVCREKPRPGCATQSYLRNPNHYFTTAAIAIALKSLPTIIHRSAKTLAWASPPWTRDTRGVRTRDMNLWRWTQCNSRSRSSSSAPCRHAVV